MKPDRRAALAAIRQQLLVTNATLDAFARSSNDYTTESYLAEAAAFAGNAADEIEKAEAVK